MLSSRWGMAVTPMNSEQLWLPPQDSAAQNSSTRGEEAHGALPLATDSQQLLVDGA